MIGQVIATKIKKINEYEKYSIKPRLPAEDAWSILL
jgi:hypothetical protein